MKKYLEFHVDMNFFVSLFDLHQPNLHPKKMFWMGILLLMYIYKILD